MGLGGVYVWSADLDDFKGLCGERWPLLTALKRNLKGRKFILVNISLHKIDNVY